MTKGQARTKEARKVKGNLAKTRARKVLDNMVVNGGKMAPAIRDAGLSESYARNPQKITSTIAFQEALKDYKDYFPDSVTVPMHMSLLHSKKIEHMVFPLGPKTDDEEDEGSGREEDELEEQEHGGALMRYGQTAERTTLTDEEIIEMLESVNCTVKKIVHGETARHVYFWTINGQDVYRALDAIYKIKGSYAPTQSKNVNINANLNATQGKQYSEEVRAIKKKYIDELRKKLFDGNSPK